MRIHADPDPQPGKKQNVLSVLSPVMTIPVSPLLVAGGAGGWVTLVALHIHQVAVEAEHRIAGGLAAGRAEDKASWESLAGLPAQGEEGLPVVGLAEGRAAAAAKQGGGELLGVVPAAAAAAGRGAADAAAATPHSALRDLLVSQMTSIKSEKKIQLSSVFRIQIHRIRIRPKIWNRIRIQAISKHKIVLFLNMLNRQKKSIERYKISNGLCWSGVRIWII